MKLLKIITLFLLLATTGFSQKSLPPLRIPPVDSETKTFTYKEVVTQEGAREVLFDRGMSWMRYYYLSPNSVANVMDRANGKIEGIGRLRVVYYDKDSLRRDGPMITYAIKIEFRDNKYRYTLNDFNLKNTSRFPLERWLNKKDPEYGPQCDAYLYQVDTTMQRLIKTLKEGMKPKAVKKDEW